MLSEEKRKEFVADRGDAQRIINEEIQKLQGKYPDIWFELDIYSSDVRDIRGYVHKKINQIFVNAKMNL